MDELHEAIAEQDRRAEYEKWIKRDQFLLSIPKDDAKEIMKLLVEHRPEPDPMFLTIHIDNLQKAMARARRRVYIEFSIWAGIVGLVASAVALAISLR